MGWDPFDRGITEEMNWCYGPKQIWISTGGENRGGVGLHKKRPQEKGGSPGGKKREVGTRKNS